VLRRILIVAMLLPVLSIFVTAQVADEIDLGIVAVDEIAESVFDIKNSGDRPVTVSFSSSCPCVDLSPATLRLAPGESHSVAVSFDPTGYSGKVERLILVAADDPALDGRQIRLTAEITGAPDVLDALAFCLECEDSADETATERYLESAERDLLVVDFYSDVGCAECRRFLERELADIRAGAEVALVIETHDVMDPVAMDRLLERLATLNRSLDRLPLAIIGDRVYQGLPEISTGLASAAGTGEPPAAIGRAAIAGSLPTLGAVAAGGLIDGINPCAFSTILFLVSMLALLGHDRRRILTVGIVFAATIFLGYLAIGLGLLSAVRSLLVFPVLAAAIRWALVALLVALAVLSIRDALLARQGRTREMTLQLSGDMKRRVHAVMRRRLRGGSIIAGTVLVGVLVTLFEFSCTGQVYVPVLMHLARTEGDRTAIGLIILYNVMFILPLVAVFSAVYAGHAVERIAHFFSRRLALVKALLAALFLSFAVLTAAPW